jgi:hypothetical protein
MRSAFHFVIPAQAGIQAVPKRIAGAHAGVKRVTAVETSRQFPA